MNDPKFVKWAKWGSIILGFTALLWATGVATITTAVRWAASPIVRDETRARQGGDSLIVARLEAMDRKQDILAAAFQYPDESKERIALLRLIKFVEPQPRDLPPEVKVETEKH